MLRVRREPPDRATRLALIAAAAIAALVFGAAINPTATAAESNADCLTSSIPDGPVSLTAGLGPNLARTFVIGQGEGSVVSGSLASAGTGIPGAYLCVYSRVLTEIPKRASSGSPYPARTAPTGSRCSLAPPAA